MLKEWQLGRKSQKFGSSLFSPDAD